MVHSFTKLASPNDSTSGAKKAIYYANLSRLKKSNHHHSYHHHHLFRHVNIVMIVYYVIRRIFLSMKLCVVSALYNGSVTGSEIRGSGKRRRLE